MGEVAPVAGPTGRRVRREDVLAAVIVLVTLACLGVLAGFFFVETQFHPVGGAFGIPTTIPLCGRWFSRAADSTQVLTRAEIEIGSTPGHAPVVLEPSLGQIPLVALVQPHPVPAGMSTCDVVIYLHVGPDAYVGYALEGGP